VEGEANAGMPLSSMYCNPRFWPKGLSAWRLLGLRRPSLRERSHNLRQSERAGYVALTDSEITSSSLCFRGAEDHGAGRSAASSYGSAVLAPLEIRELYLTRRLLGWSDRGYAPYAKIK
jgi:hypothetical protein